MKIIGKIIAVLVPGIVIYLFLNMIINSHVNDQKSEVIHLNSYKVVHNEKELKKSLKSNNKHLIIEDAQISTVNPLKIKGINDEFNYYYIDHEQESITTIFITQSDGRGGTTMVPQTTTTWDTVDKQEENAEYITINGVNVKNTLLNKEKYKELFDFSKSKFDMTKLLRNNIFNHFKSLSVSGKYLDYGSDQFSIDVVPAKFKATVIVQIKDHKIIPLDNKNKIETSNYKVKKQVSILKDKISFWKRYKILIIMIVIISIYVVGSIMFYENM